MATKARHLKTPFQLWIVDNRKRLGLTPTDLAQLTGVTTDTARGWESRGRPSEDAIAVLERRFGVRAPNGEAQAGGGELAAAIRAQTEVLLDAITARDDVIERLLRELAEYRSAAIQAQTVERSLIEALPDALAAAIAAMRADDPEDARLATVPR